MKLVSRGGWNARPPKAAFATVATETFIHHSGNDHRGGAGVRAIQDFHMDVRGWLDIAYNFLVDPWTLVVYEGRGWGVRPGSQKSYNTGTWSVCVMGDFRRLTPSEGLLDTIALLIAHGVEIGHLPRVVTGGHRDAPGQSTECPGDNLWGAIPTIRTLLASPAMSKPIQNWARDSYEWALSVGVYRLSRDTPSLDAARETIEAQRQMVFLHRHHTRLGHGGADNGHHHDGRYLKDVDLTAIR